MVWWEEKSLRRRTVYGRNGRDFEILVFGVEIEENWAFAVEFEVEMRLIEAGTKSKRAEEGYCFSVDLKHRGFYVRINN